jgi:tyrosyl-DNA phosphodiesterase 1
LDSHNNRISSKKCNINIYLFLKGSSVGAIKNDWLLEFGKAATGKLVEPKGNSSLVKKRAAFTNFIDLTESDNDDKDEDDTDKIIYKFKLVFPTLRTVESSCGGPEAFGTLFCKKKDFESLNCPTEIFHDCVTGPDDDKCKYSMHSKIMTVSSGNNNTVSYIYCGSHNFTASAWGKTTKQGSMLMINNFEVGVLIPASEWKCEYPYLRPAPKYKTNDLPWDQSEYFKY